MKFLNTINEATAKKFSLAAGATALVLSAITLALYLKYGVTLFLADAAISALCGIGILKGNRLAALILLGCTLASRYDAYTFSGRDALNILLNAWIVTAYALGVIGTLAGDRLRRAYAGEKPARWIDPPLAAALKRLSGGVGIGFALIVAVFSIGAAEEFSLFNLLDSALILLFAWQTLRGRRWAAILQALLCAASIGTSYLSAAEPRALGVFIPLLLLQTYLLGIIGVTNSGLAGRPLPITSSRQSPI